MAFLVFLTFFVGLGLGFVLALTGGVLVNLRSKERKELAHIRRNLKIAENGLRRAANPMHDSQREADIALVDIETNTYDYLKGTN